MNRDCSKIDNCEKIAMILDKDMLDFQYPQLMQEVCDKCTEYKTRIPLGVTCHYERINKKWFVVWDADFPNDTDGKEEVSEKEAWLLECGYLIGKSEAAK